MLTENQITDQLASLAEERVGYERRRGGAEAGEPIVVGDTVKLIDARIAAVDERVDWLHSQSNEERERPKAETRLRGAGKQTRTRGAAKEADTE